MFMPVYIDACCLSGRLFIIYLQDHAKSAFNFILILRTVPTLVIWNNSQEYAFYKRIQNLFGHARNIHLLCKIFYAYNRKSKLLLLRLYFCLLKPLDWHFLT